MKQHYNILILICIGFIWFSCERNEVSNIDKIKIGTADSTLKTVNINRLSQRNIVLLGGNGKYRVNIENSKIATAKISKDTLKLKGILEGKTYATILSHNEQAKLIINVVPNKLSFTQSEVLLRPKDVNKTISLGGGSDVVELTKDDPEDIMDFIWNGKTGVIEITGRFEGDASIIATSQGVEPIELKVKIRSTDDQGFLQNLGYYSTTSGNIYQEINPILIVKRKELGTLFSGTTRLNSSQNWYQQISPVINPTVGEKIKIKLEGSKSGTYTVLVEEVRPEKKQVVLRGRGFKFVVPYY